MKIPRLTSVSLVGALTGCATSDFTPYVGEQQKWPTAKGAFVTTVNSYDGPGRSGTGQHCGVDLADFVTIDGLDL